MNEALNIRCVELQPASTVFVKVSLSSRCFRDAGALLYLWYPLHYKVLYCAYLKTFFTPTHRSPVFLIHTSHNVMDSVPAGDCTWYTFCWRGAKTIRTEDGSDPKSVLKFSKLCDLSVIQACCQTLYQINLVNKLSQWFSNCGPVDEQGKISFEWIWFMARK